MTTSASATPSTPSAHTCITLSRLSVLGTRRNIVATLKEPYMHPKDDENGSKRGAKPIDILCGDNQYD